MMRGRGWLGCVSCIKPDFPQKGGKSMTKEKERKDREKREKARRKREKKGIEKRKGRISG